MSGLLGALSSAARALEAQQFGLEVAGQNIANVNTPGYTRRTALFAEVPDAVIPGAGNGVEIVGVRAARDEQINRRLRQELPAEHRDRAIAEALALVETAIGGPGDSLDARMTAFFDAAGRLASDPTSAATRQDIVRQADALAAEFRSIHARIDTARREADQAIRLNVEEVNRLAGQIARLNAAIGSAPAGSSSSLQLRDELDNAVGALSRLVDVSVVVRSSGGADVSFGNGRPLVVDAVPHPLRTASAPPLGFAAIASEDGMAMSEISGGTIGGLLHTRDVLLPAYLETLDQLAHTLGSEANAIHRRGFDSAGNPGGDLFQVPAPGGAAAGIRVAAAVLGDPALIAAASRPVAGDNGAARELAALRNARVFGGTRSAGDEWAALVYTVGSDASTARQAAATRADIVRQVESLREQVSGVSLDEEAMMMMKFQRAYEANARFFRAVDQSIDTLIQALAR